MTSGSTIENAMKARGGTLTPPAAAVPEPAAAPPNPAGKVIGAGFLACLLGFLELADKVG